MLLLHLECWLLWLLSFRSSESIHQLLQWIETKASILNRWLAKCPLYPLIQKLQQQISTKCYSFFIDLAHVVTKPLIDTFQSKSLFLWMITIILFYVSIKPKRDFGWLQMRQVFKLLLEQIVCFFTYIFRLLFLWPLLSLWAFFMFVRVYRTVSFMASFANVDNQTIRIVID